MTFGCYKVGETIKTESGQTITLTNTSDPTCLTGVGPNGELITVRRSEVSKPVFNTYKEKIEKLENKYNALRTEYSSTCAETERYASIVAYNGNEQESILHQAGTVCKFNLGKMERSSFDRHYDLYWAGRHDLVASKIDELNLIEASGNVKQQIAYQKRTFGV